MDASEREARLRSALTVAEQALSAIAEAGGVCDPYGARVFAKVTRAALVDVDHASALEENAARDPATFKRCDYCDARRSDVRARPIRSRSGLHLMDATLCDVCSASSEARAYAYLPTTDRPEAALNPGEVRS